MAYSSFRFTENAAGMVGRAGMAMYDGRGNAGARTTPPQNPDQGGDELADIRGNAFFTGQECFDAVREASKPDRDAATGMTATTFGEGAGLPIIIFANDATAIDTLYLHSSGELRMRGGNFLVDT